LRAWRASCWERPELEGAPGARGQLAFIRASASSLTDVLGHLTQRLQPGAGRPEGKGEGKREGEGEGEGEREGEGEGEGEREGEGEASGLRNLGVREVRDEAAAAPETHSAGTRGLQVAGTKRVAACTLAPPSRLHAAEVSGQDAGSDQRGNLKSQSHLLSCTRAPLPPSLPPSLLHSFPPPFPLCPLSFVRWQEVDETRKELLERTRSGVDISLWERLGAHPGPGL